MNLKNLNPTEKDNVLWLLDFIEDRSLRVEEIKKNYSNKNVTVFVSLHDVEMLINGLLQGNEAIAEFRESVELCKMLDLGKEILFKGTLTHLIK